MLYKLVYVYPSNRSISEVRRRNTANFSAAHQSQAFCPGHLCAWK